MPADIVNALRLKAAAKLKKMLVGCTAPICLQTDFIKPNLPTKRTFLEFYQQTVLTSTVDVHQICLKAKYWGCGTIYPLWLRPGVKDASSYLCGKYLYHFCMAEVNKLALDESIVVAVTRQSRGLKHYHETSELPQL